MTGSKQHLLVALLSDLGTRDWYVAAIKAVILSRLPRAQIVDITHEVPPQDILTGAFTLAAAAPWFARGSVFVAVVDPGVGTQRAILAAQAHGKYFVGPDNGILTPAIQGDKRARVVQVTNRRHWLKGVSQTFQGRDIMAPVASHLAAGGLLRQVGVPARRKTPLLIPMVKRLKGSIRGEVIHIDSFGNLVTNIPGSELSRAGTNRAIRVRYKGSSGRIVQSFAQGAQDELLAIEGSLGFMELVVRSGSAERQFRAARGDKVELHPIRRGASRHKCR